MMTLVASVKLYQLYKKKTYALIINKDFRTQKVLRIDPSKAFFTWKKGAYNITESWIKHNNHYYLLYLKGRADPINPVNKENSRVDAEVYQSVLDNEALKALNKPKGLFAGMNKKTVIIAIVIIVGVMFLLQSGAFQ